MPLPRTLPGRSLAELGFLVPSKLPQGSLELRDSAPKWELQYGWRPVCCAALFTTKARDRPAVEALVEAGFEEGRAADRATTMLEAPARRGPWGERHVQRMPEADSEGVFGFREPLRLQPRHIKNRSLQGEMFDASRFSANNGRQQGPGLLMRKRHFAM